MKYWRLLPGIGLTWMTAAAQDVTPPTCQLSAATGSRPSAIYGQLFTAPPKDSESLGLPYQRNVLAAIRQSLKADTLAFAVYAIGDAASALTANATVRFTVARDGRIRDVKLEAASLAPAFDRAVVGAVARADSDQLLLPLPGGAPGHVIMYLSVFAGSFADTTPPRDWRLRGVIEPLLRAALPEWKGHGVGPTPVRGPTHPQFPVLAYLKHETDSLLMRFVVDERGQVVPQTIFFETGTYVDFAEAIVNWLPEARFTPGMISGCPVKAMMMEYFRFKT